jgi:hypothetical protein
LSGFGANQKLGFSSVALAIFPVDLQDWLTPEDYDFRMKTLFKWPHFVLLAVPLIVMFGAHAVPGKPLVQSERPSTAQTTTARPSNGPDCSGSWPTTMAFALLKNQGIANDQKIDFSKTKTVRLASEKTGKDLYHQVYDVTFTEYSGRTIEAIAVHDASYVECSMTGVELFVVSQRLK